MLKRQLLCWLFPQICLICSKPESQPLPPPLPSVHLSSSSPTLRARLSHFPGPAWPGRAGELQCYTAFRSVSSIRASKGPPGRCIASGATVLPLIPGSCITRPMSLHPASLPVLSLQHMMLFPGNITWNRWKEDVRLEEVGVCKHPAMILFNIFDSTWCTKGGLLQWRVRAMFAVACLRECVRGDYYLMFIDSLSKQWYFTSETLLLMCFQ